MSEHNRHELVEAYILHVRKYRDTSMIVELLTRDQGRVAAVVRGVRSKRSKLAGYVQPFSHLLVSWYGRGELKTVRLMDYPFPNPDLHGDSLLLGLYVNELLVRLMGKYDPAPEIFDAYGPLLAALEENPASPRALRNFELLLLRELGYGITFEWEAGSGEPVDNDALYRYVPDEGVHRVAEAAPGDYAFRGRQLLSIVEGDFGDPATDACAKRIIRSSFAVLLGGRPLMSRELFRKMEDSL